jgi:hypothetical protein
VSGEFPTLELGPDSYHAAADVHADRCRDDRAVGGDDRSDGGAFAKMGIWHECDVGMDEGHAGGPDGLGLGLRVEDRCPRDEPGSELLRHDRRGLFGDHSRIREVRLQL